MGTANLLFDRYDRVDRTGYVELTKDNQVRTTGTNGLFGRVVARLANGESANARVKEDFKRSLVQKYGDDVLGRLTEDERTQLEGKGRLSAALVNDIVRKFSFDPYQFAAHYWIGALGLYDPGKAQTDPINKILAGHELLAAFDKHIADASTDRSALLNTLLSEDCLRNMRRGIQQLAYEAVGEKEDKRFTYVTDKLVEVMAREVPKAPLLRFLEGVDRLKDKGIITDEQAKQAKADIIQHGQPRATDGGLTGAQAIALVNPAGQPNQFAAQHCIEMLGLHDAGNAKTDPIKTILARHDGVAAFDKHIADVPMDRSAFLDTILSEDCLRNVRRGIQQLDGDFTHVTDNLVTVLAKEVLKPALLRFLEGVDSLKDKRIITDEQAKQAKADIIRHGQPRAMDGGLTGAQAFALVNFAGHSATANLARQANSGDVSSALGDSFSKAFTQFTESSDGDSARLRAQILRAFERLHASFGNADLGVGKYFQEEFLDFSLSGQPLAPEILHPMLDKLGMDRSWKQLPTLAGVGSDVSVLFAQLPSRLEIMNKTLHERARKAAEPSTDERKKADLDQLKRAADEAMAVFTRFERRFRFLGETLSSKKILKNLDEKDRNTLGTFGKSCGSLWKATQDKDKQDNLWSQMIAFAELARTDPAKAQELVAALAS